MEAYKEKYSKVYFYKLEELKKASAEWKAAGDLDKEDLLEDYRAIAIKEIYEQANCDLVSLFEKEPKDITVPPTCPVAPVTRIVLLILSLLCQI